MEPSYFVVPCCLRRTELDPFVVEIVDVTPEDAFLRLASQKHCIFLDSARRTPGLGRFSFVAADPFEVVTEADGLVGLQRLGDLLSRWKTVPMQAMPPFQGGAAGLLTYELSKSLERLPESDVNEFPLPQVAMALYDVVVAFDHERQRAWVISQGFPECRPSQRQARAQARAEQCLGWLRGSRQAVESPPLGLATELTAPCHELEMPGVLSNFTPDAYHAAVQRAIDYVHAGDVFQVNLAQRLLCRAKADAVSLYRNMRQLNAAPFAGYFDLGQHQIISASPERFLSIQGGHVEARPIKGTRQRTTQPEADLFSGAELLGSAKDLAENVMIVDLMRNDLSQVCRDDSITVTQLCGLETYEFVQHLVSVVRGELREDLTSLDVVKATFPGGSITGAPKVRAMEIIAELEGAARQAYCGSLGYLGFDGAMDLSILIRTVTASRGWWQFPVGGGIVANSDPRQEYAETWVKAQGMLRAIQATRDLSTMEPAK